MQSIFIHILPYGKVSVCQFLKFLLDWLINLLKLKPKKFITERDWAIKFPTLFDLIKPSIALFIPAYNENIEFHQFNEKMDVRELEEMVLKNHEKRKRVLFKEIKKRWNLFAIWFDLCDLFGHMFWTINREKLKWAYEEMNSLVPLIKEKIDNDYLFLIVSDHGMELSEDGVTGNHSKYFFWSLNKNLKWRIKEFKDFFDLILEMAK